MFTIYAVNQYTKYYSQVKVCLNVEVHNAKKINKIPPCLKEGVMYNVPICIKIYFVFISLKMITLT